MTLKQRELFLPASVLSPVPGPDDAPTDNTRVLIHNHFTCLGHHHFSSDTSSPPFYDFTSMPS
jgi:hypothetical protein